MARSSIGRMYEPSRLMMASAAPAPAAMHSPMASSVFFIRPVLISHSRVDVSVRNVHQQIEKQHDDRNERDDTDDERFVAVQVRVDEVITKAGQREDALDDNRAGQ